MTEMPAFFPKIMWSFILLSMTVQTGNATSIMGTLGPLRKLEDFFDVISPREEES